MTELAGARDILVLNRIFDAPVERVFDAWTRPDMLAKWFGPEGFTVSRAEVNLAVGGSYDIEICSPDGEKIRHFGDYLDIAKPHKLIFTWMLADQACKGSQDLCAETIVSLAFKRIEQATELTLTHEQLPDRQAYDGHKFGWISSLNSLTTYLQ